MPSPILTDRQKGILQGIFASFADKIERIDLFGSRATGNARANSDIDLVVYGTVNERDISRLFSLFEESALEVPVDVVAYHLITYPPFKQHIDDFALTLMTRDTFKKGDC